MRNKLIGLGFALILALTTYAPALAHECFIANRSDVGSLNAGTHSQTWVYVSAEEVYGFVAQFAGGPALTSNQLAWAVAEAKRLGAPSDLAINTKMILLENTPNDGTAKMSDSKGVDHVFDWLPTLLAIYQQARLQQPV